MTGLVATIRAAWEDKTYRKPVAPRRMTRCLCTECDEIEAYFGQLSSPYDASDDELPYQSAALSLFTPYHFHRFFPAFMLAALRHRKGPLPMTLLFHINKSDADMTMEYSISRLRLFTQSQWDVIIEFLKAVRD